MSGPPGNAFVDLTAASDPLLQEPGRDHVLSSTVCATIQFNIEGTIS